ncbi:conjugative transposon protein TraN [Olivibacter sp. 47]|jgi:conjugative transposon TraN protein|uniref:conjugative transposon protein TraN n=1 Tax=Olivibacter sp. 47 TaxID=3056486 RepID=UPI0025A48FF6|nr:conjugative transposon protein TraN [Olivibacter sp. 47]MDM8176004.1 conjugative transposon protein TraN [Olivibacter sp. 47]
MKKIIVRVIAGLLLISTFPAVAQTGIEAMNLEISDNKTTNLVYPYPVISVDRGSPGVLAQKATGVENVLQIKAATTDFEETNLTVITADGKLYSYLLSYNFTPYPLNVNYKGNGTDRSLTEVSDGLNASVLEKTAASVAPRKKTVSGLADDAFGINLSVTGIYSSGDLFYFQANIENSSNIDFDTDQLRVFIRDDSRAKRTATQETEIQPVYRYAEPSKVPAQASQNFVLVLRKFTIPNKKHLVFQLFESRGGRNPELKIKNRKLVKAVCPLPDTTIL